MRTTAVEPGEVLPTRLLHPVLDTYLSAPVGITGCHSYGIARACCEYDVVIVSKEPAPRSTMVMGESYIDLFFPSEKDVLGPSDPELAVSLAQLKPVRDSSLIFSTSSAAARAVLHENLKKSAEGRLAKSLKSLGRADAALSKGALVDADFWLLSSAHEFAFAWLYLGGTKPAPSHLLEQLRAHSAESPGSYEAFSRAAGLEKASKSSCGERLESLSVVYDAVNAKARDAEGTGADTSRAAFEIVRAKAGFMNQAMMHADCYAFLGLEVCSALSQISEIRAGELGEKLDPSQIVTFLSEGERRMLGGSIVTGLGLTREKESMGKGIDGLRAEISGLAKDI
ncbi:MAG TPA: hypothetical protein VLY21_03055 [Nitrososphaerales archaeon]|nr:hypothetical protein [Nitrososphaerales archaeon]